MRIKKESKYSKRSISEIECTCRCSKLNFEVEEWTGKIDEGRIIDYTFSFTSNFLGKSNGRLRAVWNALLGKEVYYAEVCCDKEEAVRFLEESLRMIKEN